MADRLMKGQYFFSTRNPELQSGLAEALFNSLAPDGGLYLPAVLEPLPDTFWATADQLSFQELAFFMAKQVLGTLVPDPVLEQLCNQAFDFEAPLVQVDPDIFCLELFHGPSLAFKDYGARFMARLMSYLIGTGQAEQVLSTTASGKVNVLVATSGDTGGAVASGFLGTPGIEVTILYPEGRVSSWQELQLTTLGQNIKAIAVRGSFDDCQGLVKQAFADQALNAALRLTSANSINFFRLLPQSFYYGWQYAKLKKALKNNRLVVAVPSGNFGNLCAGLLAQRLGCPISHFVAATNANDVVPRYLQSGLFEPKPTIPTISNAMDVGLPSNWERITYLFSQQYQQIKKAISGYAQSDEVTTLCMEQVFGLRHYVLEPHAATAYLGLKTYLKHNLPATGVFLGTAHPAKFLDVLPPSLANAVTIPTALTQLADKPMERKLIDPDYNQLKSILMT